MPAFSTPFYIPMLGCKRIVCKEKCVFPLILLSFWLDDIVEGSSLCIGVALSPPSSSALFPKLTALPGTAVDHVLGLQQ